MSSQDIVKEVSFVGSFDFLHQCPEGSIPEYAFVGRSNVGKSSLINALTNHSSMARVSKTPGKTQNMNYYLISKSWYLVDLPGYGYAQISKKRRIAWDRMIHKYLIGRSSLVNLFVLLDSRIGPQKNDMDFLNKLGELSIPFSIIYTKIDKVRQNKIEASLHAIRDEILTSWESLPQEFITSSVQKKGLDEILQFIHKNNQEIHAKL